MARIEELKRKGEEERERAKEKKSEEREEKGGLGRTLTPWRGPGNTEKPAQDCWPGGCCCVSGEQAPFPSHATQESEPQGWACPCPPSISLDSVSWTDLEGFLPLKQLS